MVRQFFVRTAFETCANIVHHHSEMRNPLSAILQCADEISTILSDFRASGSQIIDAGVVADSIDAAQTIALCAQHQKRIVDDVLTLSKLDSAMLMVSLLVHTHYSCVDSSSGHSSRCATAASRTTRAKDVRGRSPNSRHPDGVCSHEIVQAVER
jgi:signal transduction histidine kinase